MHQVVGADGKEIDAFEQFIKLEQKGGDFEHRADLDPFGQFVAVPAQMRQFDLDQRLRLIEFFDDGNHRKHQLEAAPAGRSQQRANLAAQQAGPIETEPDRPPTKRRVFLLDIAHVRQYLVATNVEGAEGDRLFSRGIKNGPVECELFARPRQRGRNHELQFGTEKANAHRARVLDVRKIDGKPGIDHQRNLLPVFRDARPIP